MAKQTRQEAQATRWGAALGLIGLLVAFGVIASVNIAFASILDPFGDPVEDSNIVFGLDNTTDLLNDPIIKASNCVGFPFNTALIPDFSGNSSVGSGNSWNDTISAVQCSSAPGGNEKHAIITQLDITAQEFLDTGVRAIGAGYSHNGQTFGNLTFFMGIVSPTALITEPISSCASCPKGTLVNGVEEFFALDADAVAFLASFPDWHIAFQMAGNNENSPQLGNMLEVDFTGYGQPIEASSEGQIQNDLFGTFGASTILALMYYSVAFLGLLGALMILPGTTIAGMKKRAGGK